MKHALGFVAALVSLIVIPIGLAARLPVELIRQTRPIADRQVEIEFLEPGAQVFCFTFG
jgi:hypothetical protein